MDNFKERARHLKGETFALYLAARHPETPWYAKVFVAGIVAYAFSPIDLIPDFVPVLGYLDDLILIPLGIAVAIKLIPPEVLADCRSRAQASMASAKPVSRIAAVVIVGIWITLAALGALWAYEAFVVSHSTQSTK
ncbi:MAG: YkvA family protein [Acidobacteriota bacterium]